METRQDMLEEETSLGFAGIAEINSCEPKLYGKIAHLTLGEENST